MANSKNIWAVIVDRNVNGPATVRYEIVADRLSKADARKRMESENNNPSKPENTRFYIAKG